MAKLPNLNQKRNQLIDAIQERLTSYEINNVVELMQIHLELTKNKLLNCERDDFLALQGEARAYERMLADFRRPSIPVPDSKE